MVCRSGHMFLSMGTGWGSIVEFVVLIILSTSSYCSMLKDGLNMLRLLECLPASFPLGLSLLSKELDAPLHMSTT
jgi:hypothetical protein